MTTTPVQELGPLPHAAPRIGVVVRANTMKMAVTTESTNKQVGGDHYKDMAIEPSEFIHKNHMGWLEGNAIKYICRHSRKHGIEDINKAIHYLELLKEWQYGEGE